MLKVRSKTNIPKQHIKVSVEAKESKWQDKCEPAKLPNGQPVPGLDCKDVGADDKIQMRAIINVTGDYCFDNSAEKEVSVTIHLPGVNNGELKVTVECEKCDPKAANCGGPKPNHEACKSHGTLTCGACECK